MKAQQNVKAGEWVEACRKGLLIRAVETKLLELAGQGKVFGTLHSCIGQELAAVSVVSCLKPGDAVLSNHRGHGHFLAFTDDVEGLVAEIMGRRTGVCGGKGGTQHLHAPGFFSNGILGGMSPVSAGLALGLRLKGSKNIAVLFIGDGALGEGVVYESLNIAAKWEVPLLIVLENNFYAQSTSQKQTLAGGICERAAAFGIPSAAADIWERGGLLLKAGRAVSEVRRTGRPFFLRVDAYRLMPHSRSDDNRDPAEIEAYRRKDPLRLFARELPAESARIQAAAAERVERAVSMAEAAEPPSEQPGDEDPCGSRPCAWRPARSKTDERVVGLIHSALRRNMRRDKRIVLIGEDIEGPYGGAFKVTRELSLEFPGRVRNTPVSEAAILGVGNGLALGGFLPVVEIMFGDFLALAADQWINHAAKFRYMYGGKPAVPLVVRAAVGGRRGYGPTHSQSLEKHLLGLPGTRVLALNLRCDPAALLDRVFETLDRPTLVLENKLLYGERLSRNIPEGFAAENSDEPFPTARLRPRGRPDLTVLCYGGMLGEAEAAAERLFAEHEIVCELLCPSQIYPFNPFPLEDSLRRTGRLLVVEEGLGFAAFGAEAVASVAESDPGLLKRARRLSSARHPIPGSFALEQSCLPGAGSIVRAAIEVVHGP